MRSQLGTAAVKSRPRLDAASVAVAVVGVATAIFGATQIGGLRSTVSALFLGWSRMIGPVVLVFVALVLVVERWKPAEPRAMGARGEIQDGAYLVLYLLAAVPFVVMLNTGFARLVAQAAPWIEAPARIHLPLWVRFGLAFVAMDGCNWLGHWMDHRFDLWWRFHSVHHSQRQLGVLTTFRAHPLVHVGFMISLLPALVVSSGVVIPFAVLSAYVCCNSLTHANLRWSYGPVGKIVVSPRYHRLHHELGGDMGRNLGAVLTVWDVLARRAVFPTAAAEVPPTGLVAEAVPNEVETADRRPLRVLAAQLAEPFGPRRSPRRSELPPIRVLSLTPDVDPDAYRVRDPLTA